MKDPMPRLSETLTGPKSPDRCQACGCSGKLTIWFEHDENDRPEAIYIALCTPCSDRLIEPHPRLYNRTPAKAPLPGIMTLCLECRHRDGMRCHFANADGSPGPGLTIEHEKPGVVFLDGRRGPKGGRRHGWHESIYFSDPTACTGREEETN